MIATVLLCSLATSSAFQMGRVRVSDKLSLNAADDSFEAAPTPVPAAPKPRKTVQWIPLKINAPLVLDGSLAGDVGFDPVGFSRSKNTLFWMREAEIKHSRLAMLAAVGWPISELWHKEIAQVFGLESILMSNGRVPSLLNGGLSNVWASGILVMSILLAGYLEGKAMNSGEIFWSSEKSEGYVPGDYGFDPLQLGGIRGNSKDMQTAEIKNGRLAMLAITGFAFAEFANQDSIVNLTPFLF
jgi:hypothetical protein